MLNTDRESAAGPNVKLSQGVAYSLPHLATTFLFVPVWSILPGIYAKHYGLALTTIATIIFVSRLFDAVTDPLIGYLSDRHRARTGTRKPWLIGGGALFIVSSYFLFVPQEPIGPTYFLFWLLAFCLGWTLFEIPHITWGGELTADSHQKTKIYSLRSLTGTLAAPLFFAVPMLPFFETREFTPDTLQWSVLAACLTLPLLIYLCVKTVPDGPRADLPKAESFRLLVNTVLRNKPFLLFLVAYLLMGTAGGMWTGLIYIFVDGYLGLGDKLSSTYLLSTIFGILALGFWYKIAAWFGKNLTLGLGMASLAIATSCTALLEPGESTFVPLTALMCLLMFGSAALSAIAPSVLSDIVDYGTWKFGVERAGTYFSAYTLFSKANLAVGGALGLGIAGWYGFDPAATAHSEENLFGLRLAIAYLPGLILLISVILIALLPINARRHAIIRRRLDARETRMKGALNRQPTETTDSGPQSETAS